MVRIGDTPTSHCGAMGRGRSHYYCRATWAVAALHCLLASLVWGASASSACPATCYAYDCDDWVDANSAYTCALLESTYSCDCTGCICDGTAAPTLTPVLAPWSNFTAADFTELADGLGPDLFNFGGNAGRFEVDLLGRIIVEATLKVGPFTTLVLKSTTGRGELNGDGARRVLEVEGGGASARLDGVAVKDGRHEPSGSSDKGGCIRVSGTGATLTLDGGAVVSGCESVGAENGVRVCVRVGAPSSSSRPPPHPTPSRSSAPCCCRVAFRFHGHNGTRADAYKCNLKTFTPPPCPN